MTFPSSPLCELCEGGLAVGRDFGGGIANDAAEAVRLNPVLVADGFLDIFSWLV